MIHFSAKQKKQLAKNLRTLKDKTFPGRGSGKELAAKLEISPQLLSNWLNGSRVPSALQLARLARVFNVAIQELCALPRIKHKLSAWENIIDLTKLRERARSKGTTPHDQRKRLEELNLFIENRLQK